MHNVHDLERRWLRYKIKSYIPHFLTAVTIITTGLLLYIYMPVEAQKEEITQTLQQEKIPETVIEETKEEVHIPLAIPENTVQSPKEPSPANLVLEPSLHFMDNIEDGLNPYVDEEREPVTTTSRQNDINDNTEAIQDIVVYNAPAEEKKKLITMTKNQDESDLKDVIRRFKQNKNPSLSLFIAKRYYELEQYQKSYNYALMTNEIDKGIDESWIIFSKSLVKLGQHELATLTLKSYLKSTKSTQAEILLRKIESGEFR